MNKLLLAEKEKLDYKEEIMGEVCSWWSERIQKCAAEFVYVNEKLKEEYSDKLLARFEELQNELNHLNQKKEWEERELKKLEIEKDNWAKKESKDFKISLASKLSKNIKPPKVS